MSSTNTTPPTEHGLNRTSTHETAQAVGGTPSPQAQTSQATQASQTNQTSESGESGETRQIGQNGQTQQAGAGSCTVCPLAQIPAAVWKTLLHRPFRKRHPVLFWAGAILLSLLVLGLFMDEDDDGDASLLAAEDSLALVSVRGPIMDVQPLLEWLRRIERRPEIKGILVRVDSPGGGAAASQEVYNALARLGKTRTIAVSMGSMAASGGLMVSMAGQRVFANASTVTGSIGVRMDIPQVGSLLDKIGVGQETLTTAPYKDAGSVLRPLSADEKAYFGAVLKDMHEQFVDIVATGRRMERAKAAALANGKIYTGCEALKLGLVDALGGQEAAHRWLASSTGVPYERKLVRKPSQKSWLERSLKSWLGLDLAAFSSLARATAAHVDGQPASRGPAFLYMY